MSTSAQRICIEVLSLPRKSRVEIAEKILTSIEEDADKEAQKAWRALIRRRRSEIRSGKARLRTAEEVMKDALRTIS
ncbi:MAG: addiction module protein [Bryobacteraceae bacterium]